MKSVFLFAFLLLSNALAVAADSQATLGFAAPSDVELKNAANLKLSSPMAAPPTAEQLEQRMKQMSELFKPVDYDPALRAKELGNGIEPSFQYVRDQIRFESYPGVLRGPKGTYMSRAGNAADRALLLAELLKVKGIEYRFAVGHLDESHCQTLFARMFGAGADDQKTASATATSAEFVKAVRDRALRDYAAIRSALGDGVSSGATPDRAQVLSEIANHVWVQAKSGEQWLDLDSAFADAAPGKTYCTTDRVVQTLPAELYQQVIVRVVIEKLEEAALKKETVLETTRPAADLLDRQIFFTHSLPAGVAGLGNAIANQKPAWRACLWIDGDVIPGKPFSYEEAGDKPAAGRGLAGAFDDPFSDKKPAGPAMQVVSETLEFELTTPGAQPQITRHVLLDRGGAAWHRAAPAATLRPLESDENGPIAPQAIHNIWFSAGRHDMAGYTDAMMFLLASMRPQNSDAKAAADQASDFGQQVWPIAMQNLMTVLWSEHAFLPALNDNPSVRFYTDSPRILLFGLSIHKDPASTNRLYEFDIDLRRDHIRGVAKDDAANAAVAQRKLWYDALEGALEHETIAAQASAISTQPVEVSSTSAWLGKGQTMLLTPKDAAKPWESFAPNKEVAARIATALGAGETLVVPQDALASADAGWWAISPSTGDLRPVFGEDYNGGRINISGGYVRQSPGMYGGSSGPNVNYVNPNNYNSYRPKPAKGGGNEYATILVTISTPSGVVYRITVAQAVKAAVIAAAAAFAAYEIAK